MRIENHTLHVATFAGINLHDLTPDLRRLVADSHIRNGFVIVASRHSTTAITVNENEGRLLDDARAFFQHLVPAGGDYRHNDLHLLDVPPGEPRNAHSHILAMLLGGSETIPIADGELILGRWQSVLLAELDGPRERGVAVQIVGE
ncbi:MAG: YjbQ family protein [Betaproteobacteria bacterium]|nr:YjbQ family protein [Betaproteobacteria bacterium]